jgi:hypothetical protein
MASAAASTTKGQSSWGSVIPTAMAGEDMGHPLIAMENHHVQWVNFFDFNWVIFQFANCKRLPDKIGKLWDMWGRLGKILG